jgi:diaminohydroxyphosphoribosylaminopyrimidine deaminase/5-amino-6-(5-phosphoribosylamino)uracil reductase
MDAILVGIGTALADDPQLTARPSGPRCAARVVLDSAARLPCDSQLARTARAVPVWLAVTERAPVERCAALAALGCDIIALPGAGPVPIIPLLDALGQRGVTNLLVEGGGRVLGAFLDAGQVDAVDVYIAPILAGGTDDFTPTRGLGCRRMADALRLDHHEVSLIDGDLRLQGTLAPPARAAE